MLKLGIINSHLTVNLFSPVCVRKCLCSSSDRVNLLPQNSHLHTVLKIKVLKLVIA